MFWQDFKAGMFLVLCPPYGKKLYRETKERNQKEDIKRVTKKLQEDFVEVATVEKDDIINFLSSLE